MQRSARLAAVWWRLCSGLGWAGRPLGMCAGALALAAAVFGMVLIPWMMPAAGAAPSAAGEPMGWGAVGLSCLGLSAACVGASLWASLALSGRRAKDWLVRAEALEARAGARGESRQIESALGKAPATRGPGPKRL